MTANRECFVTFDKALDGTVTTAKRETLQVRRGGTIEVPIQGKMTQITGIIHVPDIGYNLLSVSQFADRGINCQFVEQTAKLSRNGTVTATATRRGKAYVLGGFGKLGRLANNASMLAQDESRCDYGTGDLGM
jgi:hypothetical protein